MELYPRLFGWDIKQFTNCRFGMMGWPLIIISFAAKQQELYGLSDSMLVAVTLQLIYITKFFIWEPGYLRSLDIMHDRAGYYICWGCLVWVPSIYTSPTLYLVNHPNHLGSLLTTLLLSVGTISILINYLADRQRQLVRANQGNCHIWGKEPIVIIANYQTATGESKQNLLLASGWWGLSRHFHYLPELLGAFCWSAPALFTHFIPYFYFIFLTILLFHRVFRDDQRCSNKYGKDWQTYCQKVPYKIIPFII
jgi:7-dehydrocholesterol reductase